MIESQAKPSTTQGSGVTAWSQDDERLQQRTSLSRRQKQVRALAEPREAVDGMDGRTGRKSFQPDAGPEEGRGIGPDGRGVGQELVAAGKATVVHDRDPGAAHRIGGGFQGVIA
jgi:hypothetical protein